MGAIIGKRVDIEHTETCQMFSSFTDVANAASSEMIRRTISGDGVGHVFKNQADTEESEVEEKGYGNWSKSSISAVKHLITSEESRGVPLVEITVKIFLTCTTFETCSQRVQE